MLGFIGESPVSTLAGSLGADVTLAVAILDQVTLETLEEGWSFNTDLGLSIAPDGSSNILVPANTLRIDLSRSQYFNGDVVQRDTMMYDRCNQTSVFTGTLKFDVVYEQDFEEIPQVARTYIHIRASRRFVMQTMGSPNEVGYTLREEQEARYRLLRSEGLNQDNNVLNSPGTYRLLRRTPL